MAERRPVSRSTSRSPARPIRQRDTLPGRGPYGRSSRHGPSVKWSRIVLLLLVVTGLLTLITWRVAVYRETPRQNPASATPPTLPTRSVDPREHLWMGRPLARTAPRDFADRTYLFGSSKNNAYRVHHGSDMVNPTGTPVQAAADGVVVFAGQDSGTRLGPSTIPNFYGNVVIVKLNRQYRGQDVYYLNGHLSEILVREGQQVKEGDSIGKIGMTGTADGPHLHFEVRVGQNTYANSHNAALWMHPLPATGVLVGRILDKAGRPIAGVAVTLFKDLTPSDVQKYWGDLYTYFDDPLGKVNSDDDWQENFAVTDLPVGRYEARVNIAGQTYLRRLTIADGQTTWLEVQEGSTVQ